MIVVCMMPSPGEDSERTYFLQAPLLTVPLLLPRHTDSPSSLVSGLVGLSLPNYRASVTDGRKPGGTIASSASSVSPNSPRRILVLEDEELKVFPISFRSTTMLLRSSTP